MLEDTHVADGIAVELLLAGLVLAGGLVGALGAVPGTAQAQADGVDGVADDRSHRFAFPIDNATAYAFPIDNVTAYAFPIDNVTAYAFPINNATVLPYARQTTVSALVGQDMDPYALGQDMDPY